MKKSNRNGFMLIETLLVSTFVLGVLTYIFVQFSALKRSYDDSFRYDTVPSLYGAKNVHQYLSQANGSDKNGNIVSGYNALISYLADDGYTELSCAMMSDTTCKKILTNLDAEIVYFVKDNIFKHHINTNTAIFVNDEELYYFCKKINFVDDDTSYHLVVKFTNNTYATIAITL